LVEDIPYRRLRYRGNDLPTLQSMLPAQTIQLSSFSKLLSPGLRVGTAYGPLELINSLAKVAEDTYITPSLLNQALVYRFLANGWLDSQVEKLQTLYGPRLEAMLGAVQAEMGDMASWVQPEGGFFVGLTLKWPIRADDLLARGKAAGLALSDGRGFFADRTGDRFVRLPFCALSPDEICNGIKILADVVRGLPEGGTK
jgi:2-aminoadipate transaminase